MGPQRGSMLGHLIESLVTLCVRVPAQAAEATVAHLRTRNGDHEIDLVAVRDDGRALAIEVKLANTVSDHDTKHLHWWRNAWAAGSLPRSSSTPDRTRTDDATASV